MRKSTHRRKLLAPAVSLGVHLLFAASLLAMHARPSAQRRAIEMEILTVAPAAAAAPALPPPPQAAPEVLKRTVRPARRAEAPPPAAPAVPQRLLAETAPTGGPSAAALPEARVTQVRMASPEPRAALLSAAAPGGAAFGVGDRVVDAEEATTPPALLSAVRAQYPEEARQQGVEVDVALSLIVRADGTVAQVRVLEQAGFGFDEAAAAAARRFRFRPATLGAAPIAVRLRWVYQFRLE